MELILTEQDEHTAILRKVWDQGGEIGQLDMVTEEAAEVIQAINKWKRFHDPRALDNLHMEVADLQICLDQLYLNFLSAEEVKAYYRAKMKKLEQLLYDRDSKTV